MKFILTIIILLSLTTTNAQEQLTKIKTKNLVGVWESNDSISNSMKQPILVFNKVNTELNQISTSASTLKINKDESMKIIRKNNFIPNIDTISAKWFFVENSKNLKIIEKVNAKHDAISYKDANGNQTNYDFFITKITTYHVDYISDNKLILKYINVLNK